MTDSNTPNPPRQAPDRVSGYYWVQRHDDDVDAWEIAQYLGDQFSWSFAGADGLYPDDVAMRCMIRTVGDRLPDYTGTPTATPEATRLSGYYWVRIQGHGPTSWEVAEFFDDEIEWALMGTLAFFPDTVFMEKLVCQVGPRVSDHGDGSA